jgi:ankyrin repeat protein
MLSLISEEAKKEMRSDYQFSRTGGIDKALKENNIDKRFYNLRRIYHLVTAKSADYPTAEEKENFEKAIFALASYISNYGKPIDFTGMTPLEINELFMDECYDYIGLTGPRMAAFFENGADFNFKDSEGLNTFQYASRSEDIDVNREFLKRNADVNDILPSGRSIWNQNFGFISEKIKLFLDHGAIVNTANDFGETVLHQLVQIDTEESLKSIQVLIERGADVNLKNANQETPLNLATKYGVVSYVLCLLEKDPSSINEPNKNGVSPLFEAIVANKIAIVELLLKFGADKTSPNKDEKTPYALALSLGHAEIAALLNPGAK